MKKLFSLVCLIGALCTGSAMAQKAGVYPVMDGSTIVVPASTTNTVFVYSTNGISTNTYSAPAGGNIAANTNLWLFNVNEYDYVGLTWAFTGTATSTNDLRLYKSNDGGKTFESNPSFSYLNIAPGAAGFLTNASLDLHGATTIAIVVDNKGTTTSTNQLLEFNLKSPKFGARQATQ